MQLQNRSERSTRPLSKAALLPLILAGAVAGCDSTSTHGENDSTVVRKMEVSFESELLAKRGPARASHELFDARMAQMPARERAEFVSDPGRIGMILDELIMADSVLTEALDTGMLDDPDVQARLYLALSQQVIREARELVRQESDLPDYEARAREIYLSDPEKYMSEAVFSFTQVLVDDEQGGERRANELLGMHRDGTPLERLAVEYSDDPSVENNEGVLSDVNASRLDGDFLAALERMEVGDVEVVQTRYGWHVVRLDELTPQQVKPFEEVAGTLTGVARNRHLESAWERYLRKHSQGELEIAPGAIAKILERYPVEVPVESGESQNAP